MSAKLAKSLGRFYTRDALLGAVAGSPVSDSPTDRPLESYRDDPVGFCTDVLGVTLTPDQAEVLRALPGRVKVNSGHNIGKAENVDTLIDTPQGRRRFGDLRAGDYVFGPDGCPTRILATHPQGIIPQYRVTFNDGSYAQVSGEHLWAVQGRQERREGSKTYGTWKVLKTDQIREAGLRRKNGAATALVWSIPTTKPVKYAPRQVPLPAYVVGQWLGNGTVGSGEITAGSEEACDLIRAAYDGECSTIKDTRKTATFKIRPLGAQSLLRDIGVLNTPTSEKRVPLLYMENSTAVRLAVLQGLLDSDGTVGKQGAITFCSTSEGLVDDVMWLVRSLGGRASKHPAEKKAFYTGGDGERIYCKIAHLCTVSLEEFSLFRLSKKLDRVRTRSRTEARYIENIESEGTAEMVCLTVDREDGQYLTKDFIVTHNTFVAACACLWWFYTRPKSVVITTAPTERDVIDLLWTEIRILVARAKRPLKNYWAGPKSAEMFDNEEHWAKGYTARDAVSFQGRHRESMLYIFDECEGIPAHFWEVTNTSYKDGHDHGWLAIGNPVTTASQSYVEDRALTREGKPKWKVYSLSVLNHPNVLAELAGGASPVGNAVSVSQIDGYVADWCDRIDERDKRGHDFEWRPGSGVWYRPGPQMLARALGIRPIDGVDTVFGAGAWATAITPKYTPEHCWLHRYGITIGLDCAAFGDDYSCFHVRSGPLSLHHESRNGWPPRRLADRLKELAVEWAAWYNAQSPSSMQRPRYEAKDVNVVVELDVSGADVLDHCINDDGSLFGNWGGLKVAEASDDLDQLGTAKYSNKRSEIWFTGAKKAASNQMDLSRLPKEVLKRLEDQLLTPSYKTLPAGTRQVEAKPDIKKRLRRSPDDADSLLVCYSDCNLYSPTVIWKQDGGRQ